MSILKLRNNHVVLRKDKVVFSNKWRSLKEKQGYLYEDNTEGVVIIPYRMGRNGREVLLRDEYTPLRTTTISAISGRRDAEETGSDWWKETGRRELLEEAGILTEPRWFEHLGEVYWGVDKKKPDQLLAVDVTGLPMHKPITDGSIWEKKSENFWVDVKDLKNMISQPTAPTSAVFITAVSKFLAWCGMTNNFEKSKSGAPSKLKGKEKPGHKYIRREGQPGNYKYIYKEPEGKTPGKPDEKEGKGSLLEQLVAAVKGGGEKKAAPKEPKIDPLTAFSDIPADLKDFKKGVSAAQWMNGLEKKAFNAAQTALSGLKANSQVMGFINDDSKMDYTYAGNLAGMLERDVSKIFEGKKAYDDFKVDNPKLSPSAERLVKRAMLDCSVALAEINFSTEIMNSSFAENVWENLGAKLTKGIENGEPKVYDILDRAGRIVEALENTIHAADSKMMEATNVLGQDPKLDFLYEQVFKAVDNMIASRNRFVENGFRFYMSQLEPRLNDLSNFDVIDESLDLIEKFERFKVGAMHNSITSQDNKLFANQWNLKQRGVYDGASKYLANATGKLVGKAREISDMGDLSSTGAIIRRLASKRAFDFMTFKWNGAHHFHIGEQVFAYIDAHGLEGYFKDTVFLAGGRKSFLRESESRQAKLIDAGLSLLDKAIKGVDVYNDPESNDLADSFHQKLGEIWRSEERHGFSTGAFNTALNNILILNPETPANSKLPAFIRIWSIASHNSLCSAAIEELVDSRGIDRSTYVNYHLASNRTIVPKRKSTKEALEKSIKAIYEEGQKDFSYEHRNKDAVKLYRGNGKAEVKSVASSWSSDPAIALRFGDHIAEAEVPKEAVLLFNSTLTDDYWSFPQEQEYIVVPGLLPPENRMKTKALTPEEREKLSETELAKEAELYGENY